MHSEPNHPKLNFQGLCAIWYYLYNFLKKLEKHPWRNVTFSNIVGRSLQLYINNTPPWVFFMFCANGAKSHEASRIKIISQKTSKIIWVCIVCTPPPFCLGGREVEPPTKFSKNRGRRVIGSQFLEGACWERGG